MTAPAYQADGQPVAREAFYAIACDPQRSVVVEACAGAGKTWMLVSRILRALLEGAQPQEILAITFTRKAAGEMRARLGEWLREFADHGFSDERRAHELVMRGMPAAQAKLLAPKLAQLHEQLLVGGRTVEIRTFHAWFSQLLRAAPLDLLAELGLASGMALMEDLEDHRAAVFHRFHTAVLADDTLRADHAALVQQRGRDQVLAWLDAALNKRVELELADEAGVLEASVPAPDCEGHPTLVLQSAIWRSSLRELAIALALGGAKAQDAATGIVMALAHTEAQAIYQGVREALFTKAGTSRKLGQVPNLAATQDQIEAIEAQVQQLDAHLEHLRLVRLSRVLLSELAAYKRARGLADMADLERCALALLRDATLSGWVQERLDTRIRHVLIDEFQDTSPLQWHALHSWLSAYAGAGGGHSGQRPPGVFIVGDPKQSIYRFRRAEPRVFAAAREFVSHGLGGTWLACDHTRRNAPQVLEAVNAVFVTATQQGEYGDFRAHTTELGEVPGAGLLALPAVLRPDKETRAAAGTEPAVWRDSLNTPRHEPEAVLREQEARWVAQAIHELLHTGQARAGEVFVLCRKRASLRLVAQALQTLHLPFAAAEDFSLMDAPEVRDLVAVLDVLASPSHRLSLAHALRSPLFGVSDDDLVALALAAEKSGDWWAALVEPGHADRPALQRAATLLRAWQDAAKRLPPHDLLDRIVFEGAYRERMVAVVPAERRLAALDAVDALLSQALMLDGARYATPYNFVRALKRRAIKVAAPVQPDAVQLLTVHGAKGLEARVVFVMDSQPEASNADTATLLVDWPVEADRPARCAFIYSEARCPPSLQPLLDLEKAARQREELNGLYVAMTRAKERLVFSRTEPHRATASWWQRIEALVRPWEPGTVHGDTHAQAQRPIVLQALPVWVAPAAAQRPVRDTDTPATRLGQAVHRTLEWASAAAVPVDVTELAAAAAMEFAAPAAEVARVAAAIWHSPACRPFFAAHGLSWAGNEVPVAEAGELLRIDRLVQLTDGAWWVLDYKLALQPETQAAYRDQMLRYRRAVMALQPGEPVRCALINGQGSVIEVT